MFSSAVLLEYIALIFGYVIIKYAFFRNIDKSHSITFFEFVFVRLYFFKRYYDMFGNRAVYYIWLPDAVFMAYFFIILYFF